MAPKIARTGPQDGTRGPQDGTRGPQEGPRRPQEVPFWRDFEGAKWTKSAPRRLKRAPRTSKRVSKFNKHDLAPSPFDSREPMMAQ
eukprot:868342-Pyramimonas_sp.AAC.1